MRLIVAACAALFGFPAAAHDGVRITDPWIRALGAGPGAGYFTIENHSDQPDRLLGVIPDPGERAELHANSTDAAGISSMTLVDALPLAPGETVSLTPGGLHLMILGLPRLEPGATVILRLSFERAGEVVVEAPLDNRLTATGHDSH